MFSPPKHIYRRNKAGKIQPSRPRAPCPFALWYRSFKIIICAHINNITATEIVHVNFPFAEDAKNMRAMECAQLKSVK